MDVIGKIEQLRKERGWSVYKLATEAGLSQSALFNMYNRGTLPSLNTLFNICDAFKISMADFFRDTNSEATPTEQESVLLHEYRRMSAESKELLINLSKSLK